MDKEVAIYSEHINRVYPALVVQTARLHTGDGQFNDIVIVNNDLIFRFPRSPEIAGAMVAEVALLSRLQPYLSLAIPNPIYSCLEPGPGEQVFMGYPMISGELLRRETLATIADEVVLQRLATQLATFLRELHGVPVSALGLDLPMSDGPAYWSELYTQFREHLFPYMRPDAREHVTAHFTTFLDDPRQFAYQPVLRHGDFGAGNILYDPRSQRITGVIDFDSVGLDDPAVDLAAMLEYGETFVARCYPVYPELASMVERTTFYRGTYALQQALYALYDGDQESFEDGIAAYV